MKLILVENFRAVFYCPFYLLKSLGYAEEEGLDIEWVDANIPGGAIDTIKRGDAHVTWGGPMRIMKDHDATPWSEQSLVGFCEVVGRDPFALVSRRSRLGSGLSGLSEARLGVASEVPTPWLCLQEDLRLQGIDLRSMCEAGSVEQSLTQAELLTALRKGETDVVQLFEPYVSEALRDPQFAVMYDPARRGPTTYTVFITTCAQMSVRQKEFAALTRAMARTQEWLHSHPDAIAERCAAYFPDIPAETLRAAVHRYISAGIWSSKPAVQQAGLCRLRDSLVNGRFVKSADLARVIAPTLIV